MSDVADDWLLAVAHHVGLEYVGGSSEERLRGLRSAQIGAGWICGLLHASERRLGDWQFEPIVAPVMAASRYEDRPVYFGDVIVAAESEAESLEDLAGRRLAINEESSLSGHDMLVHRLGSLEQFAGVARSGSHRRSLEMVRTGRAEVACIDSTVMDMGRAVGLADVCDVRVLEQLGPYPAPPVVVSRLIDPSQREVLRQRLVAMEGDADGGALLQRWGVARFAEVDQTTYATL